MNYEDGTQILLDNQTISMGDINSEVPDNDTGTLETQCVEQGIELELSEDVRKSDSAASELYNSQVI